MVELQVTEDDALSAESREIPLPEIGMGGALNEGTSIEWWTPPRIFEALGVDFDLDPCAPPGGVKQDMPDGSEWRLPAARSFSIADDGLSQPWEGRVWLNPPYGKHAKEWVGRLIEHGNGIALVFLRCDAKWAQRALKASDAVCLIAGRLSFIEGNKEEREKRERAEGKTPSRPAHNAANGSMLLAYGEECAEAVRSCGLGVSYGEPDRAGVEDELSLEVAG